MEFFKVIDLPVFCIGIYLMALFDNGYPEEFLLFIGNFQMTLEASATIASGANIHYLCTLVRGEALVHIDMLSAEVVSTTSEHL